jgi:UDP-N-acetylmuramoyl-L-alanyl-D-glutamate--2,6-diaminopimelate ligase
MSSKIWFWFRSSWLGEKLRLFFPDWLVNFFWHLPKAVLANFYFGFPSRRLLIIGVTGTDGKTTTATLIYKILLQAGKKTALISTVSAEINQEKIPTGLHVTSPEPFVLQALLKKIAGQGIKTVVLEVTSHGLHQHRLWGVPFRIGVVTNITPEHLDYHRTYQKYLAAKGKLFKRVEFAVLNKDDQSFGYLNSVRPRSSWLITYSLKKKADFTLNTFKFKSSLPGDFNQSNCLAAIAAARTLGVEKKVIRKAIQSFKGVLGRMDEIRLGQNFRVLIDFAHTANALEKALTALKKEKNKGQLIVVFGCAGLRDPYKRPIMGRIAAKLADRIVLTAEDPRTENLDQIIDQIAKGCLKAGAQESAVSDLPVNRKQLALFFRVADRRKAIKFAIQKLAEKGDLVVICGKGHERSMCYGKTENPWSDHREAQKALRGKLKK